MTDRIQDIPGYEMISELGEGGMATVYLAIQHSLDRKVAIKVMRRELRVSSGPMPEFERRFLLEGRTMAKLPHRNIVAVYDIVTRDEVAYISMELLEGGTLSERMRTGLSLGEAIGVIVQLANGLEYAHRNGVIHRDLKPSNVMFRDANTPVLTDFGIAKQSDVLASRITQTGLVLGTPTYMSPEQASGRDIDGRADQYALGILFYEMLTGNPPFTGENPMTVLMGHALQPPPPLPDDLQPLQPVFDRMLAKEPNDRFDNLQDFVKALRGLVVGNDALGKQLGNITAATASERLRALGFSGDYTDGDSGFALDLLRMPQTDPSMSRHTTSQMVKVMRERPRLLATVAAAFGVIILGLVLWAAFKPRTLSQDDQYLVRTLLREADRLVASGDLLTPPGENAFEDLQKVLQKDPENDRALELLTRISAQLRSEAELALGKDDLDGAGEKANQALLVMPDDLDVQALVRRIGEEQEQREVAVRVDELLRKARAAEDREQRTGPDGAYALLRTALSLTPLNPDVQARLKAVTDAEFARVREQLQAGNADQAGENLAALQAEFGSDPAYAALDQEIRLAQATRQSARRIEGLLEKARSALAAGKISEPAGDNAFDWFEQARQVDSSNAEVNAFKQDLAARILEEAQAAQTDSDVEAALDRSELALRVDPNLEAAASIRDTAQKTLGSQRAAIASQLNLARSSIASGRLLPPSPDNARDVLDQLLGIDPQNADALKLREALPRVVADALRGAIERNDLEYATSLAASAAEAYPSEPRIAGLIGDVRRREAASKVEQAQQASERQLAALLQNRPMNAEDASAAAQAILTLREVDAAASARFEAQLEKVLANDVQNARTLEAGIANLEAVEAVASRLDGSSRLATITATAQASVTALKNQRDQEAAARNGELVINALPWGLVDQVLDASRKPVELPSERSTPMLLTVPAGSYYITLRHPESSKAVSAFARVTAGKRSQTSGSFPTLSAEEYINRAGL
ncbi:protein kinase domain-containing protein [Dokdonella sp.]|uniref:serine/threonine protein kinase n=1 Tax=Dokdonella sp. TaxID=2291710 RepID=UPI003C525CD8